MGLGDASEQHLFAALSTATALQRLDVSDTTTPNTTDEVSNALATSGSQLTSAGVHGCVLGAQLPPSVVELQVSPLCHLENPDVSWGWFHQAYVGEALQIKGGLDAAWIVHRHAGLYALHSLSLLLPVGWQFSASAAGKVPRLFTRLQHLELRLPLGCWHSLMPLTEVSERGCSFSLQLDGGLRNSLLSVHGSAHSENLGSLLKQLRCLSRVDLEIRTEQVTLGHLSSLAGHSSLRSLVLELDYPWCRQMYELPSIASLEVLERGIWVPELQQEQEELD